MGWTTPRDWTDTEVVTAAIMNPAVRDNLAYLKTQTDKLDDVTVTTPANVVGTIYQNLTGKIKAVTIQAAVVSAGGSQVGGVICYIGSASPPTTLLGNLTTVYAAGTWYMSFTFLVPPNWYYKVTDGSANGGSATVNYWTEFDLL